jgi:membrane-bound serine protease (ClpP class)
MLACVLVLLCPLHASQNGSSGNDIPALTAETPKKNIYVLPIKGEVEPAMAAFITRVFRDTAADTGALFVLDIDTFGGRVDSALQIVDTILNKSPGKVVSFVRTKAISAGALIALAGNELVMRPNTTIGDCAPISFSGQGPQMLGEKFQSPLRAQFRTLARRNGYPQSLAESMVTAEMEVFEIIRGKERIFIDSQEFANLSPEEKNNIDSKKTVVAKGELLTMDDVEAHQLGFSRMSVNTIETMLERMAITNYTIIRFEPSWSESMGKLINALTPVLMMLGLAGIYTELKSPGFGIPGILGILCLGLVFLNQYLVGLADHTELLIIILGIVLLGLEVFVLPGFGLAGITGFAFIGFGMVLAFQDFVIPSPAMPWQMELFLHNSIRVLGSGIFAFFATLFILRYIMPRFGTVADGPYLQTSLAEFHADSIEANKVKPGDIGTTITTLRPAGKMQYKNDIIDVISQTEFIDKHTKVKIIDLQGNKVIVGRLDE